MIDRAPLLRLLDAHQPYDEHEAAMLARLREFVCAHEDCFDRSLAVGHITGSAWVVDFAHEYVLLTYHCKLNKWLQLGGHADGEPDVLKVALREAREESGLIQLKPVSRAIFDVDVHDIPARPNDPAHHHHDVRFLVEADRSQQLRISAESKALRWVQLSSIRGLTGEESVLRMARKTPPRR